MNDLLKSALFVLPVSAAAMMWGLSYRSDHAMAAVGALFGGYDETYDLAGYAAGLDALAFAAGLVLLIAGLVSFRGSAEPK